MASKRDKIEIIYDILNSIYRNGNKIRISHLLQKANLSHTKLKKYLEELEGNEIIINEIEKGVKYFSLTEKGINYYYKLRNMKQFMNTFNI
jgi:predicted transcriptional regulator